MEVLPEDDNETYVNHLYYIVIAWILVTVLIGIFAAIPAM